MAAPSSRRCRILCAQRKGLSRLASIITTPRSSSSRRTPNWLNLFLKLVHCKLNALVIMFAFRVNAPTFSSILRAIKY